MRNLEQDIIITNADFQRLLPVLDQHDAASASLDAE